MADTLTPYDTGVRAEPKLWSTSQLADLSPIERSLEEDRYGKVDFDDDGGTSLLTVWVERNERGFPVVHIQQLGVDEVAVVIHRD